MNKLNKIKKTPKAYLKPTSHISHLTSNKGITLTSLVIYITVMFVVLAMITRVITHFRNNMAEVADVTFETKFEKLNLYLLDESKKTGNKIEEIIDGTQITFSSGNKYNYNVEDKTIYLNDNIKICENVDNCIFEQEVAINGKNILKCTITIAKITKIAEYVMANGTDETYEVNIRDYLWGGSLISYYLKAGDYVSYTPDTGTYKVADGANGSGRNVTETGYQEFTTETGENSLNWRILSIDEGTGKINLVAETVGPSLTLCGTDGYNHGVDILNDLCETLYSKTVNGIKVATGRSLNVEDINAKTTFNYINFKGTYNAYGGTKALSDYKEICRKYPNLYEREKGYAPAGMVQNGLNVSEGLKDGVTDKDGVTTYSTVIGYTDDYDSSTNSSKRDVNVTYTYYFYTPENYLNTSLGINTIPRDLIKLENTQYWLASRCIYNDSDYVGFRIRYINSNGSVNANFMVASSGSGGSPSFAIRPVVSLSAELLDFSQGDGSKENPWKMK